MSLVEMFSLVLVFNYSSFIHYRNFRNKLHILIVMMIYIIKTVRAYD